MRSDTPFQKGSVLEVGTVRQMWVGATVSGRKITSPQANFIDELEPPTEPGDFSVNLLQQRKAEKAVLTTALNVTSLTECCGVDCSNDAVKDINGDWEHWVPVMLPEMPLDATNEPLDLWAFTGVEGEVVVNVERADMTEILFYCGGLHRPEAQLGHPFHDCKLGSWQWGAIRIGQMGVEFDEARNWHCPVL